VLEHKLVQVDAAEPVDALRPPEQAEAVRSLCTTAASNVPPPKSYTAIVEPGSTRSAAA
jgi:hypothetical protein